MKESLVSPETPPLARPQPSAWRAWFYLVRLSFLRQARARQMVWIALGLLVLAVSLVAINTALGRWTMTNWRIPDRNALPLGEWLTESETLTATVPFDRHSAGILFAANGATEAMLTRSDFLVFTRGFVFLLFFSFLLPVWSLSFATEALGGERESQTMIWLLTRPIPRPAIYLARFLGMLPWCIALTLGGFALTCAVAGRPGPLALRLFWPAVFWGSLGFAALFFMIGAFVRRPAIVALVYSFFLEIVIGNLPGTLKRISVGFYARCMMFTAAETHGLEPENPVIYEPITGDTARLVLLLGTIGLVLLGMMLFRRAEAQPGD